MDSKMAKIRRKEIENERRNRKSRERERERENGQKRKLMVAEHLTPISAFENIYEIKA